MNTSLSWVSKPQLPQRHGGTEKKSPIKRPTSHAFFCLIISVSLCLCGWICQKMKPATDPEKDRWPVSGNLSPGAVSQTPHDSPSPDRPSQRRADRNSSSDSRGVDRSFSSRLASSQAHGQLSSGFGDGQAEYRPPLILTLPIQDASNTFENRSGKTPPRPARQRRVSFTTKDCFILAEREGFRNRIGF